MEIIFARYLPLWLLAAGLLLLLTTGRPMLRRRAQRQTREHTRSR